MNLTIGNIYPAVVLRVIETGYVLDIESNDVLLHHNETKEPLEAGEELDVFLYQDKTGQTIATTHLPNILPDTYGFAEVVEVLPKVGVFVNIGIAKDILTSVDDLPIYQKVWPKVGDRLYVRLGHDQEGRLLAIPATEGVIEIARAEAPADLFNKSFTARVYYTSREGAAVVSEEGYRGFIHHTERDQEPRLGELITGRVIGVKEDGTVNVSLKPLKQDRLDDDADTIMQLLDLQDGVIPFSDKSDPEEIRSTFNFSKSAFKRALGRLMRAGKVEQRDGKTYRIQSDD